MPGAHGLRCMILAGSLLTAECLPTCCMAAAHPEGSLQRHTWTVQARANMFKAGL